MKQKREVATYTIKSLEQREKQLNCLYDIEEILGERNQALEDIMNNLIKVIPRGFTDTRHTQVRIEIYERVYLTSNFVSNECTMSCNIKVQDENLGMICVSNNKYDENFSFSKEDRKFLKTIADRIASFILHQKFSEINYELKNKKYEVIEKQKAEWKVILEMLKKTDQTLFSVISKKMLNHMFTKGIEESNELFRMLGSNVDNEDDATSEVNRPTKKQLLQTSFNLGMEIFTLASKYFSDEELLIKIQKWIHEEKSYFLVKATSNINTPLSEVADAIRRYHLNNSDNQEQFSANVKGVKVSLIRRFLTDQLDFIEIAKHFVEIKDFYALLHNLIYLYC
jgi:pyruvate,water dikinase